MGMALYFDPTKIFLYMKQKCNPLIILFICTRVISLQRAHADLLPFFPYDRGGPKNGSRCIHSDRNAFFQSQKCESSCCGLRTVIGRFLHRNVCSYKAEFTMGDNNVCKMSFGAWRRMKSWRFSSLENVALDFG